MEYFKRLINNWIICPLQAVLDPSSRVPGSLSDRWSSLTTIYPLRFHEIFGRWLSYNIKRWLSLASIYPLRFHELFCRWLSYNIKRRTKIEEKM